MTNYLYLMEKLSKVKKNELKGRKSAEEALKIFEEKAIITLQKAK